MHHLVSIVITTHNRSKVLPRAIDSALAQTYPLIELIVVNDGSTDDTDSVMNRYLEADSRVVYIKHEQCRGGNAARNTGIKAAHGYFIAGLDDDDEFLPGRVATLVEAYTDSFALVSSRSIQVSIYESVKTVYFPYVDASMLLWGNFIGNQVLIRKSVICQAGLFDEDLVRYQDYDMWLRVLTKFGVARILREVTQIIHYEKHVASDERRRRDFAGAFAFYRKHKALFNTSQRRTFFTRIRVMRRGSHRAPRSEILSRIIVRGTLWASAVWLIIRVQTGGLASRVFRIKRID